MLTRIRQSSRELVLFAVALFATSMAYSTLDSIFNNFINERFSLTGFQRSFLEIPRELPGFLVVFISALLWFLCSRRLGALSMLFGAAGALLVGFASSSYAVTTIWLFVLSLGQHLFMPLSPTIGMELAEEGKTGQRLGQFNAIRNLAAVSGSFMVFLGFNYLGFTFQHTFVIAAMVLVIAAVLLLAMTPEKTNSPRLYLKLHREYRLYYSLAGLFGSRKQLFITFAPWVLVTIFNQPTQTLATLITLGGIIGILFQPFLGWMIDRFGERIVLATEAVLLVFVCLGYGFSKFLLPAETAFLCVCLCYLLDQMLMSVGMARSTYIKKTALEPAHVQPALTAAVTIDHIFAMLAAVAGGLIWNAFGFQYVFLLGAGIALINLMVALQIRVPPSTHPPAD